MKLRTLAPIALFVPMLLTGCQPIQAPEATPAPASPAEATVPVTIGFAFTAGDQPILCGQEITGLGTADNTAVVNDARFYVSNVQLINTAGESVPVSLDQDGVWQFEGTALLDFENGDAGCSESGNAELNETVRGAVPAGEYSGIAFDLGVPFALNHQDVTVAASPLNIPAMWWNWQAGYKFVRIDLKTNAEATDGAWFIHLGSTGCDSPDNATPPESACARPNIATIQLADFDPSTSVVVADLTSLLANVNLSESTPQPPGCMSGPDDPDCANLLPAFGLDIATGACTDPTCSQQQFFHVK